MSILFFQKRENPACCTGEQPEAKIVDPPVHTGLDIQRQTVQPWLRSSLIRLVIIPLLVFLVWMLDMYLLAGIPRLFSRNNPAGLLLYSFFSCILLGILVPMTCITSSFLSGIVNTFQLGFRSVRRTVYACAMVAFAGYACIILFSPRGIDQIAFAHAVLLFLPTSIAVVMVCWVLIGTHVQAFIIPVGVLASILTGIIVTALLFSISFFILLPQQNPDPAIMLLFCIGCAVAIFFFAVRDVYPTILVVTFAMVFAGISSVDSRYLYQPTPVVYAAVIVTMGVLLGIHVYFSRHYTSIPVPSP